jgi:signal transduction histidine kinase
MTPGERPDTIDTRIILRIYAALALLGGSVILGWGPPWLGTAAATRVLGAILAAAGCWATTLSEIEDPALRRRGIMQFAAAHLVILLVVDRQRVAIWGTGPGENIDRGAAAIILFFLLAILTSADNYISHWAKANSRPISIAGNVVSAPLRSRYERQIRQAAAQEERNRLARDLHDSIKQQIFVIQTAAATAQARFDVDRAGAATAIEQIRSSARDAMTEMEVMMDNLRSVPLENSGLADALKKQCEALGHRTGARVEFKLGELPPDETLLPGSHQAMLRVAQESLANIGRHARASHVTVSLDSLSDHVELRIQDDGTGFDPFQTRSGMGIANMRTRAAEFGGQFDLTSSPGHGTTVLFSVPHVELRPGGYRKPALLFAAAFAVVIVVIAFTRSSAWDLSAVALAVAVVRYGIAWYRTRRHDRATT